MLFISIYTDYSKLTVSDNNKYTLQLFTYKYKKQKMGIVGAIKNYCLATSDEDKACGMLDSNGKAINDDYTYFQQQNWYRLQTNTLFDPNKFIFLYTNYKQSQQKLLERWKIVDTKRFKDSQKLIFNQSPLRPKWVFTIKRGVPIIYYKNVIQMLFCKNFTLDNSRKYQSILYQHLKKNNNIVDAAIFHQETQQEAFSTPFLKKEGTQAAKRISFLISKTHTQLQYNVYIIKLISLLLIFVSEADAYDIVGTMIDASRSMSVERQQSLRWHISLTNNQFEKFARQFFKTVKDISPSIKIINQHLNTQGIDKIQIFRSVIGSLFIGFVPFQVALRIFLIFLNEGVEVFYRFFYAILKMAGATIRDYSNTKSILRAIRTKMLTSFVNQNQIKQFFRFAFDLQLDKLLIKRTEVQSKIRASKQMVDDTSLYYLPQITGDSEILSFQDIQTIWSFLPNFLKHYDIEKIFTTSQKKSDLKQMISVLQENQISLIIVEAIGGAVFGIFIAEKIKNLAQMQSSTMSKSLAPMEFSDSMNTSQKKLVHSFSSNALQSFQKKKHFGSSQNFVFTLHPQEKKYPATGQNIFYCAYDDNNFTIGGPQNQPAFDLDLTLSQGVSFSSPTYCNQPLHHGVPGEFRIKIIQCFSIH